MPPADDEPDFDMKQSRLENASGWIELTRYESVRLLIDALLEAPPGYEFNKSELKRRTGLSRQAIREHLPRLIELGVVEEVENGQWPEYRLNDEGKVTKELFELNSAVNAVLSGSGTHAQGQTAPEFTLSDFSGESDEGPVDAPPGLDTVDNADRDEMDDLIGELPATDPVVHAG